MESKRKSNDIPLNSQTDGGLKVVITHEGTRVGAFEKTVPVKYYPSMAACAAANRAIGTRKGEQET